MKPKLYIHITSTLVASAGAILALGDKVVSMPGLPGWLVNAWPLVLFSATVIDRIGSALVDFGQPKE